MQRYCIFVYLCTVTANLLKMDTVVIKTRKKSDICLLHDFSKQIGAKIIEDEALEDLVLARLIEEGMKDPAHVDIEDVMQFLKE